MRVCIVLSDLTYPPREGLHQQSIELARALRQRCIDVTLVGFVRNPESLDLERLAADEGMEYVGFEIPRSISYLELGYWTRTRLNRARRITGPTRLREYLKSADYDIVHLEGLPACTLFKSSAAPAVLSLIDPGSRRQWRMFRQSSSLTQRAKHLLACGAYFALEVSLRAKQAPWQVVSEADQRFLRSIHRRQVSVAIPVMIDLAKWVAPAGLVPSPPSLDRRFRVVIYADLRQPHMVDAYRRLMSVLDPATHAETDFLVLGRVNGVPSVAKQTEGLHIEYIEWAPDPQAVILSSDVVVLPDVLGTGLKNRAIQAMATGTPVVGTEVALEGIPARPWKDAVVTPPPESIPSALARLKASPDLRSSVGHGGLQLVRGRYASGPVTDEWIGLYEELIKQRPQTSLGTQRSARS